MEIDSKLLGSNIRIQTRRAEVLNLYIKFVPVSEIAKIVSGKHNISERQVYQDISFCKEVLGKLGKPNLSISLNTAVMTCQRKIREIEELDGITEYERQRLVLRWYTTLFKMQGLDVKYYDVEIDRPFHIIITEKGSDSAEEWVRT
jgi:hypothetical protein